MKYYETMIIEQNIKHERTVIPLDSLPSNKDVEDFLNHVLYLLNQMKMRKFEVNAEIVVENGRMGLVVVTNEILDMEN